MVELQSGWQAQIDKTHGDSAFVWLWRIPLIYSPLLVTEFALTTHNQSVTSLGIKHYPWPCQMSALEEVGEDLPQMTLTLGNQGRLLAPYVGQYGDATGMLNRYAIGSIVHTDTPDDATSTQFRIHRAQLTVDALQLTLEPPNYYQRRVPFDRFSAVKCRWRFGSEECGYIVNSAAAYTDCSKHLSDCVLRGDDMAQRNLPRLQPERFGGFPSIPES